MNFKSLLMIPFLILTATCAVFGQEVMNEPPQILTADLVLKQIVEEESLAVSFVITDQDEIIEVFINDEPANFTPGRIVIINRRFVFQPGKTVIKISAMDVAGNIREKRFLVGFKLGDADAFMAEEEEKSKFFLMTNVGFSFEYDSNPVSDPGIPFINVGDIIGMDIQLGTVPDLQQPDIKTGLNGTVIAGYGKLVGFGGIAIANYKKTTYNALNSLAIYVGGGYTLNLSDSSSLGLNVLALDINTGGADFSQNIGFAPAITFKSSDEEGSYTDKFVLDIVSANYASASLIDSINIGVKWNYTSLDTDKLDQYVRTYALGSSSSGTSSSLKQYFQVDYDWKNKWKSGMVWDIGFGWGLESYPNATGDLNDTLGLGIDQKINFPLRFSTGIGWEMFKGWIFQYDYKIKFTGSTATSANVLKTVYGMKVKGSF